jgi:hypothetical protein
LLDQHRSTGSDREVDEETRFRDVAERNRILSQMMMALAKGAKAHPSA